ncbi:MAG: sugar phosphate nucleotidyltransferase [Candidatus Micrarchaeia archaeon]
MKDRLTITIDRKILEKIDATIDGINVRNRSHAIEHLLEAALNKNAPRKAVILAGGTIIKGPNGYVPKPMLLLNGKPIIEYTFEMLLRNGINEAIILAGEKGELITSYFGDGSRFGIKLTYMLEEKRKGTEGALALAKGLLGSEPFLVINGDNFYDFSVIELYKQHLATNALVTIALTTAENTKGFGVTRLEGSRILNFAEKSPSERSKLVSTGLYLFDKGALDFISTSQEPVMLEKSLFPKLASMRKLYGFVISGDWVPLESSSIEGSIHEMEKLIARRKVY